MALIQRAARARERRADDDLMCVQLFRQRVCHRADVAVCCGIERRAVLKKYCSHPCSCNQANARSDSAIAINVDGARLPRHDACFYILDGRANPRILHRAHSLLCQCIREITEPVKSSPIHPSNICAVSSCVVLGAANRRR